MDKARLAVDIGGTFTDLALEWDGKRESVKVLTTPRAPEEGVLTGVEDILKLSGLKPVGPQPDHPRHDARHQRHHRAQGRQDGADRHRGLPRFHRDRLRAPLRAVRHLHAEAAAAGAARMRFGVPERMDGRGNVLIPLDEAAVRALAPKLKAAGIEAIAVGYMHAYLDGKHERRTRDILSELLPGVSITLSSEVSPEIREYERWSTAVANAYVQPVMDRYLGRLDEALRKQGRGLPPLPDHLGRRPRRARDRAQVPDPAGRIRPGRRRHPGRGAGAPVRPRQGAVVRHGRHHRQDLPDRPRRAAAFALLRGGAAVPLPEGQRPAAAHPGDRDGRDRRRRRLDRLGRFAERASMSARRAPAPSPVPRATAAAAPSPP